MREIKFRIWDGNRMYYPKDYVCLTIPGRCKDRLLVNTGVSLSGFVPLPNEFRPEEIMQYTGLKDKEDKEIYEGDIIKWAGELQIITFDITKNRSNICYILIPDRCVEVIGNVCENPELLKEVK